MILKLPSLQQTIADANFSTKKKLGQHFLLNQTLCDHLAQYAGDLQGCNILEIGPGPGGVTRALLAKNIHHIIAIDYDTQIIDILRPLEQLQKNKLTLIHGDALSYNIKDLQFHDKDKPLWIIANLPYNIATPLLTSWLGQIQYIEGMLLMFQKEVAQRICAMPNHKNYGRLSIISQFLMQCDICHEIAKQEFTPPPKVDSAMVLMRPHKNVISDSEKYMVLMPILSQITQAFFTHRRQMIRKTMLSLFDNHADELYKKYDLSPNMRPENISLQQYIGLAESFACHAG